MINETMNITKMEIRELNKQELEQQEQEKIRYGVGWISIVPYFGGKYYLLKDVINIIIYAIHKYNPVVFVDLFGGSGKVVLNIPKEIKIAKVYNDIDKNMYTLFKVLIDEEKRQKLFDKLKYAIMIQQAHKDFAQELKENNKVFKGNDIDVAFKTIYNLTYGFSGQINTFAGMAGKDPNLLLRFEEKFNSWFKEAFDGLCVLNEDYRDVLKRCKTKNCLVYLDPPYIVQGDKYLHGGWSIDDFKELKQHLDECGCLYLMNETHIEELTPIFGKPKMIKGYTQWASNLNNKNKRFEGFWANFDFDEIKNILLNDQHDRIQIRDNKLIIQKDLTAFLENTTSLK